MIDYVVVAIKVTVLLVVALAAAAALRRTSAALRHWLVATAVVCAALVPVLAAVVPAWHLIDPDAGANRTAPALTAWPDRAEVAVSVSLEPPASPPAPPPATPDIAGVVTGLWAAGTVVSLLVLAAGLLRLSRLAATATPVREGPWAEQLADIARASGVSRPVRLLLSAHPSLVVTWGMRRPAILLPAAASGWTDDTLRVVLSHELAHIRRGDWAVLIVAHALRALHWFNPIVWLACRRLRLESEHACDDAVLGLGVSPPAYATHLLQLARAASRREWAPALPVARPSGLERRVRAMLNGSLDRRPLTVPARLGVTAIVLAIACATAGIGTAAQSFASVSGSLLDSQRAALPGVTLALSNTARETKTTVRTNREGRFEFVGLPPGEYVLEIKVPGFRDVTTAMTLDGEHVEREFVMRVGQLQETITVTDGPPAPPPAPRADADSARKKFSAANCSAVPPPTAGGVPIGGNIRPPLKVRDVRPLYPPALRDAKVTGTVEMDATIATDGTVREVKPRSSGNAELTRAAMDAVSQWEFTQTLLNCVPIEVEMAVSVSFRSVQ
jgi:TonB family protein